jgi:hypothetical protein
VLSLAEMNARIQADVRPAPKSPPHSIAQYYNYETSEYEKQLIKEHTDEIENRMWARVDEWRRLGYENAAEWRDESLAGFDIENGEGEKHLRLSDAERTRNDWDRYVFALGEKAESVLSDGYGGLYRNS